MPLRLISLIFSVATVFVAGCASTANISLDKAKTAPIATVSLLRVTESRQLMIRNLSGLPALGGVIGGAIAGNIAATRGDSFVKEYNAGTTRLSTSLVEDLKRNLSANGMETSYVPTEFAKLKDKADDYSHIQLDSDALLSVWFGPVGYVADGAVDAPFEPWVVVHVRLLHGKTKEILSQKTYTAGYQAKIQGAVFVPCAATHRFDTFDKLMSNFPRSIGGLLECERAIAQQAALDLH